MPGRSTDVPPGLEPFADKRVENRIQFAFAEIESRFVALMQISNPQLEVVAELHVRVRTLASYLDSIQIIPGL